MSSVHKGKVLVTGGNGFIGRPLCLELMKRGWRVRASVRSTEGIQLLEDCTVTGPIHEKTVWRDALQGIDMVIHLAARVHVVNDETADPLAAFLTVNFHGTVNLAKQAAECGVKRFIYLSTVKVNGESSQFPFRESDPPQPQDAYAASKYRAELALNEISRETGLEIVVIRPPLVYGPGVRANFLRLLRWVDKGLPLPLASLQNHRSLISIYNLIDFICCCLIHPTAGGQIFFVSDDNDLSTPALIKYIASAMGKSSRLFSCPPAILRLFGSLMGYSAEINRLCDSLQINIDKAYKELGWQPPLAVSQGVKRTVQWYLREHQT
jgi:nucleoside-diphosphate-sugar epimerase